MNACVLQPPNSQLLSDDVIGGVVLRAKQADRSNGDGRYTNARQQQWSSPPVQTNTYTDGPHDSTPLSPADRKRKRQSPKSHPFTGIFDKHVAIAEELLSEQQRLRELRRIRQIRYRKKKDDYANHLDDETRQLKEEIDTLGKRRRSVSAAIPAKESVWSVATEYFRLFRHGLNAASTLTSSSSQPSPQQEFLRNAMAQDVVFNAGRGPEVMVKSWKCLSMWFQDVEFELVGLKKTGANSLIAETTTGVTVSERTLRNVFPHLMTENKDHVLADKLLGQRFEMRGSVWFEWDAGYCRVTRALTQSDLLTPMLRLLETLKDTSRVFEKALISPDFLWRSTPA